MASYFFAECGTEYAGHLKLLLHLCLTCRAYGPKMQVRNQTKAKGDEMESEFARRNDQHTIAKLHSRRYQGFPHVDETLAQYDDWALIIEMWKRGYTTPPDRRINDASEHRVLPVPYWSWLNFWRFFSRGIRPKYK